MAMGIFTSPAARRALGRVKEAGQTSMADPLWMTTSQKAYQAVCSDRL